MAHPVVPPVPAPAQGQIELVARRLSVVTVRGISYEFSIQGSISDKRCDELVKNHIEYLLTASGRDSFDTITSTLKKNNDPAAEPFTLEKSNVTYVTKGGKAKNKNAKTEYIDHPKPETREKVQKFWNTTKDQLLELTTGAADPLQLAPQPANQNPAQLPADPAQANQNPAPAPIQRRAPSPKPTMITPYQNRAKKMDKNPSTVELALADQLSKMPNPKYNRKTPSLIVPELRKEYIEHINDKKDAYAKDSTKFKGIMDNLVNANANKNEQAKLRKVCNELHSTAWGARLAGYTNMNTSQLDNALLANPSALTLEQKEDLIKIHNTYVADNGSLDASSFLKAFVEIHNPKENPDMFEVVVVDDTNAHKPFLCSGNGSALPNVEQNCAFLYVDAQGRYQSIPREKVDFKLTDSLAPASVADTDANNAAVLENLIDLYDTYTEASIHNYVLGNPPFRGFNHFRLAYTHAFERLKNFIYKHDKKNAQSDAARQAIEDNHDYGGYRLQQLRANELANLLKANRDIILNIADDESFEIV